MRAAARRSRVRGFTLIEVMVAMLVSAAVVAGVAAALEVMGRNTGEAASDAAIYGAAARLVGRVREDLRAAIPELQVPAPGRTVLRCIDLDPASTYPLRERVVEFVHDAAGRRLLRGEDADGDGRISAEERVPLAGTVLHAAFEPVATTAGRTVLGFTVVLADPTCPQDDPAVEAALQLLLASGFAGDDRVLVGGGARILLVLRTLRAMARREP